MNVSHIAKLANLLLTPAQATKFSHQFDSTLDTIKTMTELDTSAVKPTSQVTGLTNVTRPDEIIPSRVLSVKEALSNAQNTQGDYFLVPGIFAHE